MSKNDIWVKEILWNITDEIINKYEKLNFPFRTVMIKSNFCYCCKKLKNNIRYLAEDSYRGRFKFLGWLYCDDCELLVNLAHENIFLYKNFIRYSKCKFLTKQKFYFWRISYTKEINPFYQKCFFDGSYNDLIYVIDNRVFANIVWKEEYNFYTKLITLSNLIYNNSYFGDDINKTEFRELDNRWIKLIKTEYAIVEKYKLLDKICYKYNIVSDIKNIINSFLDNIY
jgi:hypothetical protein